MEGERHLYHPSDRLDPKEIKRVLEIEHFFTTGRAAAHLAQKVELARERLLLPPGELDAFELRLLETVEGVVPPEYDLERLDLYLDELEKNKQYFGEWCPSPPLPEWVTREQLTKWQKQHFRLHYLPDIWEFETLGPPGLRQPMFVEYPGVVARIDDDFTNQHFPLAVQNRVDFRYPGLWLLVDDHDRPHLKNNRTQMYVDDPMGRLLERYRMERLTSRRTILSRAWGDPPQRGSRFGYTTDELMHEDFRTKVAEFLKLPDGLLPRLPDLWEWLTLANRNYPQWIEPIDPARPEVTLEHTLSTRHMDRATAIAVGGSSRASYLNYLPLPKPPSDKRISHQIGFRFVIPLPTDQTKAPELPVLQSLEP